ncbi:MAG: HyaD/HybD family hydrogenase maturation endopeptidase [Syntrophales bacterium]|nr:HyaD/HybD family hydrogenase maturation endopeptidase [Syntrophales bacterium]
MKSSPSFVCTVRMSEKKRITILGLGNVILKDDGFGVHFVKWFEQRWSLPKGVEIIEGGVMAYALLDPICNCENLIVIDALKVDDEPGSIYRFTLAELEPRLPPPTSAHEVQFLDVLCKAEMLGEAPTVIFLCIVPVNIHEMGMDMSPLMWEKFPQMEELLLKELARYEVYPVRRDA